MKTSELIGPALNWAVAKCEGTNHVGSWEGKPIFRRYSTDWSQGGPIIEREKITIVGFDQLDTWNAHQDGWPFIEHAPTPLIAAMRCYVASKLGDEVEIPEELK
jgi:hypothetical protein